MYCPHKLFQIPNENDAKTDKDNTSKSSKLPINSKKSTKSSGQDDVLQELRSANEKLRAEVDSFKVRVYAC